MYETLFTLHQKFTSKCRFSRCQHGKIEKGEMGSGMRVGVEHGKSGTKKKRQNARETLYSILEYSSVNTNIKP